MNLDNPILLLRNYSYKWGFSTSNILFSSKIKRGTYKYKIDSLIASSTIKDYFLLELSNKGWFRVVVFVKHRHKKLINDYSLFITNKKVWNGEATLTMDGSSKSQPN